MFSAPEVVFVKTPAPVAVLELPVVSARSAPSPRPVSPCAAAVSAKLPPASGPTKVLEVLPKLLMKGAPPRVITPSVGLVVLGRLSSLTLAVVIGEGLSGRESDDAFCAVG